MATPTHHHHSTRSHAAAAAQATVSAKGQVTLSRGLRRQYGLHLGDPVALEVVGQAIHLTPLRVVAVYFDHAYGRFSVRCTNRDGQHALGSDGNLGPDRVVRLTSDARWVEQARQRPDEWIVVEAPREGGKHAR